MKEKYFNQTESNIANKLLAENLNFEKENIDQIVRGINIPYRYLDDNVRANIKDIVNEFIRPNLQDALREKKEPLFLAKAIGEKIETIIPENLSIDKFLRDQKDIYVKKINLQNTTSNFLTEILEEKKRGSFKKDDAVKGGISLYKQSLEIEPIFFGYNSQNKKFIDYCDSKYFEEYEEKQVIDHKERLLLLTPSQPSYFLKREMDFTEYKVSHEKDMDDIRKYLIELYFNNDEVYFNNYFENIISENGNFFIDDKNQKEKIKNNLLATKEQFHSFFVRKQYFLLERKIKHAKDVDELLIIDNCFDKYFESKLCFLHDLFLKIYLVNWINGNQTFHLDKSNLKDSIIMAMNFDDKKLINV